MMTSKVQHQLYFGRCNRSDREIFPSHHIYFNINVVKCTNLRFMTFLNLIISETSGDGRNLPTDWDSDNRNLRKMIQSRHLVLFLPY